MNGHPTRSGVTLIELMVGVVTAVVLVLALGSVLTFTMQAWQRQQTLRNMQNDAWVTSQTLNMAIREAQNTTAVTQGVGRVYLGRKACYRANAQLQYSATGTYLAYDPNTNAANDVLALCQDHVTACSFTLGTNFSLTYNLVLSDGNEQIVLTNTVFFRN
jgi:Tfp pilus assembly protein PilV